MVQRAIFLFDRKGTKITVSSIVEAQKSGQNLQADINVNIQSGMLESSNVNPIGEMTDMIALQRQFEMQLKMMKTAEEVDSSAASLLRAF